MKFFDILNGTEIFELNNAAFYEFYLFNLKITVLYWEHPSLSELTPY